MEYLMKKRIKLVLCIIIIPGIIALLSIFLHTVVITPYVNSETKLMSRWYRDEIYMLIKDNNLTDNERKILWTLADKNAIKKIDVSALLEMIRIIYIIISGIVAMATIILTKWYLVNNENLVISDEDEKLLKKKIRGKE